MRLEEMKQSHDMYVLLLEGLKCGGCVRKVEGVLENLAGVEEVSVNLATKEAWIQGKSGLEEELIQRLSEAGFPATIRRKKTGKPGHKEWKFFLLAALLTLPVFVLSMGGWQQQWSQLVQFFASALVVFVVGWGFHWRTVSQFPSMNMDTLISLGTVAAFGYSVYLLYICSGHLYFETASMIITLVLFGRFLEARALDKSGDAIRALMSKRPQQACVLEGELEKVVPVQKVKVGDIVLIRPGEKVPLDAEIVEGSSYIDESLLTGESLPVFKKEGDHLIGATLNTHGALKAKVLKSFSESYFSQILDFVQKAQSSKAPVQRLADRVAGVFVPFVIGISITTFLGWLWYGQAPWQEALLPAVAVLLISCPCALGLATPVAVIQALGKFASHGILVRDAASVEKLATISKLALDKTGTLTEGRPELQKVLVFSKEFDEDKVLELAASLEKRSEHPLGRAICAAAQKRKLPLREVQDFCYSPGVGISAKLDEEEIFIGKVSSELPNLVKDQIERLTSQGWSVVFLKKGSEIIGVLALGDRPREGAREAVEGLKRLGVAVVMLTGDSRQSAQAIAQEVGIGEVYAELLPHQKLEIIRTHSLAMVGDGVNDAPALALAEVSIAMGGGTDVALDSANIILSSNRLELLPLMVRFARLTMRTIRQNLFFAFIYNSIGIPLAALGYLHPMLAAGAMALSSVSVVGNSNRLSKVKFR
ncbi:MAG: cadmium-translocating P-type ATPase [Planctomycetota bacterium]|nr:MAG: cadmium-translocating P-type ATPase [Planctomycetota bacterium]